MPPVQEISAAHASAVLARGCIDELRYARFCDARQCRRHGHCADTADRTPRCVASLPAAQYERVARLHGLIKNILEGRHPGKRSGDRLERADERCAIEVMFGCLEALPCFAETLRAWHASYTAPPVAPSPPVDTAEVLAGMKAELARYRMIDETRAETDALRQRVGSGRGDPA